jgi:hypothetical protein
MFGDSSSSGSWNNNVVPYIMVTTRNITLEKFLCSMEMLKNFLGGKPTSIAMSWV